MHILKSFTVRGGAVTCYESTDTIQTFFLTLLPTLNYIVKYTHLPESIRQQSPDTVLIVFTAFMATFK